MRSRQAAFTLVEVVVVMMIMGILAAAAIPTFYRSLMYHRLEAAARRVKVDLEQVQQLARTTSTSQEMTFTDSTTYTLPAEIEGLDNSHATYVVDLAASPFVVESVVLDFGGPTSIVFDGYGNPSAAGTITLGLDGEQRTISVDNTTGGIAFSTD